MGTEVAGVEQPWPVGQVRQGCRHVIEHVNDSSEWHWQTYDEVMIHG